jgi:hypothetical protein
VDCFLAQLAQIGELLLMGLGELLAHRAPILRRAAPSGAS